MNAEILSIGDELLIGQVINTNAAQIGQALAGLGVEVAHASVIADDLEEIIAALRRAWERSSLILLTGGLGPTRDDKTIEALGAFWPSPLVFSEETWTRMNKLFARFDRTPTEAHRRQCLVPEAAHLLTNRLGTAPGLHFSREGTHL
ncbi:MAG: competence/damage-inducible protein A, partial [Saprospiraceae bacterium]|nr:competence/damage-inducible protein A [Saprospiraceae bacterium]